MSTALISDFTPGFAGNARVSVSSARAAAAPARPASHLRLTRRGRLVLTALVALPLVAGTAAFVLTNASAVATQSASSTTFDYVQVESGQSLWQLAAAVAPDADPREVVSDIVHLNQLQSTDVQPGQRLAIPQQYAD